jgi:microcystin-dependent protein
MEPYLGELRVFAFGNIPRGFAACAGQLLSVNQNQALFALIGTFYGGNGISTFALPDLRSSAPVHQGNYPGGGSYTIGEKAGIENVTLLSTQMPAHSHPLNAQTALGLVQLAASGGIPRKLAAGAKFGSTDTINMYTNSVPTGILFNGTIGLAGSNLPHPNMPPFLVLNVCIATQGIFPSRN